MADEITQQLCQLLKLPNDAVHATLELRPDSPPKLTIERWALELDQRPVSHFELRPLEPDADSLADAPFDLDRAVATARARLAEFIDRRAEHHISCLRIRGWLNKQKPAHRARMA